MKTLRWQYYEIVGNIQKDLFGFGKVALAQNPVATQLGKKLCVAWAFRFIIGIQMGMPVNGATPL